MRETVRKEGRTGMVLIYRACIVYVCRDYVVLEKGGDKKGEGGRGAERKEERERASTVVGPLQRDGNCGLLCVGIR